jgi:D-hydroxyproline dehydrogenase subunit beta
VSAPSPDVAVIGGGIVGTATAELLAEAGLTVRLYERAAIAAGASGRNSGVVQHPFDPVLAALYQRSLAEYRRLGEASDGVFRLPQEPAGLLLVGRDPGPVAAVARRWARAWPAVRGGVLDGRSLRRLEPSLAPDLVACLLEMGYPVEPAAATEAFWTVAIGRGVEPRLGESAVPAMAGSRVIGVEVAGRTEPAGLVVVAAGPWTAELLDPTRRWRPIRPTWGVVVSVALAAPPARTLEAIEIGIEPGEGSVSDGLDDDPDDHDVGFSLVPGRGSSALGSTFLPDEPEPAAWVDRIRRVGERFVPGIATASVAGVRHCARPTSFDGRPFVGAAPWADGLWIAAGHGPWGISTGPGTAALLVDAMIGRVPADQIPRELAVDRSRSGPA